MAYLTPYFKYLFFLACLLGVVNLCSQQVNPNQLANLGHRPFPLPKSLTFAGEPVPLEIPDVAERLDRELQSNAYFHSNVLLALKRMQRSLPEMERLLEANGLPADFKYVALAESLLGNVISPKGAVGVWQFMPPTARELKLTINNEVDERYHFEKSTIAASSYFKKAKQRFGSWTNAAASYNRGMGGLQAALKTQKVTSYYDLYLNEETSRYVFRILALKEIMENPKRYGFDLMQADAYPPVPIRSITINSTIEDLPQFALEQGINYKTLRLHNPWLKGYKLTVADTTAIYSLQLPQAPVNSARD
ncbi:lytic transglycosylase domain-containing protein [Adhaeribacter radiodurans]|uniref:Transglycosylase SLT domain-containing protein n=1 Tax=Adhaeribacter radiodurans TaxID=2745197 RepID=A0A7L7LBA2_9BACT|nr:lytic transglycosylase domain-containing protein [Adhaeribacter radiodurans]QMU30100.1 transglycosylase SLT domain-containing protein [Adhaeribacter radiodurans]